MIAWVRPKILIPAHGEALHLNEHAELGRRAGVRTSWSAATATWPAGAGRRPDHRRGALGPAYKDGSLLISAEAKTVAARRRLSFSGIVTIALALSEKGTLSPIPKSS